MFIVNSNLSSGPIVHGDVSYEPNDAGLYEVPGDFGAALVKFPGWSEWDGTQATVGTPAPEPQPDPNELKGLPDGWERGNKASLTALAAARGVDATGTNNDIRGRLADWLTATVTS